MSKLIELVRELKGVVAALLAAFTIMSAVGLAILEWRVSVNVRAALASQTSTRIGATSRLHSAGSWAFRPNELEP